MEQHDKAAAHNAALNRILDFCLTEEQQREKKAQTARDNGAKSLGPVTKAGKEASSANAIRHGLTASKHVLLTMESPEEFDELHQAYIDHIKPVTKLEARLVFKLATLDWRLDRFAMLETCSFNLESATRVSEIVARFSRLNGIGVVYESWKATCSETQILELLRRYMTTLKNEHTATLRNLQTFRKMRAEQEKAQPAAEPHVPPVFKNFILPLPPQPDFDDSPNEPTAPSAAPNTISSLEIPPLPKAA